MRYKEFITEKYLYHATFSKNVPSIVKNGLRQFEPSNWVMGDGETRYNKEAGLFAFEHPEDATSWAQKMAYDFDNDISIVRINPSELWDKDPSMDVTLQHGKGQAMRSMANINQADVIDVFKLKDFGNAMEHNMMRDEWLQMVAKKLEQ